jgi:exodeoxyribonuclease V alpha subunit
MVPGLLHAWKSFLACQGMQSFVELIARFPSGVGGGLLAPLRASNLSVVRLTEVFRQAATSQIVTNAHRINAVQYPQLTPTTKFAESDCLWLEAPEPELGAAGICHPVSEFLPKQGINPAQ